MSETTEDAGSESSGSDSAPELSSSRYRALRIWPPIIFVAGMVVARLIPNVVPMFTENAPGNLWMSSAFGPLLMSVLVIVWWLAASRANWQERVLGLIGIIVAAVTAIMLVDKSMQGPPIIVMTIPLGIAAFAVVAVLLSRMLSFRRTILAVVAAFLGFGSSTLLRNHGMWGNFAMELAWRWTPAADDLVIADRKGATKVLIADLGDVDNALANPEWSGFRGPNRDGSYPGSNIATDWSANPPKLHWKTSVGPGWASFAVAGKMLFTQEQRGPMETVVCYAADSGKEVWTHEIESRFVDALGGDGPRATPTIADGAVFVLGASGHLCRIDARTGQKQWEQDLRKVAERDPPMWGFCASPIIANGRVIVHAGGKGDKGVLAFDVADGKLAWSAPSGDHAYGSPQLSSLLGKERLLMLSNVGVRVFDPSNGDVSLAYEWKHDGYRSLQPLVVDDKIVLPTGMGKGTQCIRVSGDGELAAEELWTSLRLKPDFNDIVVHKGSIYGFDGEVFTCLDLETGERHWKRGRYGKGQVLLLPDQDLLLVISETGELVLLEATPDGHKELSTFQAIEGRTWNHPVLIGNRLYLRNSAEAACYELPKQKSTSSTDESVVGAKKSS